MVTYIIILGLCLNTPPLAKRARARLDRREGGRFSVVSLQLQADCR